MHGASTLDPVDFLAVSPTVAEAFATLLATHPWLSELRSVGIALLGVTSRYESRLRGVSDPAPALVGDAEVRRELLFLMNTKRPLAADPTTTAADLVVAAKAEIARRASPPHARSAVRAFEHAVATIIRSARSCRS